MGTTVVNTCAADATTGPARSAQSVRCLLALLLVVTCINKQREIIPAPVSRLTPHAAGVVLCLCHFVQHHLNLAAITCVFPEQHIGRIVESTPTKVVLKITWDDPYGGEMYETFEVCIPLGRKFQVPSPPNAHLFNFVVPVGSFSGTGGSSRRTKSR